MEEDVRSSLPLPTELLVQIFQYCEDYDWPTDPHDDYIPFKNDPHFYDVDATTWLKATSLAKETICNIRLTCKSFLDASILSFATILGHRRFRLTKTGVKDLQDIGTKKQLAPLITTLSFGAADVHNTPVIKEVTKVFDEHKVEPNVFERIQGAVQRCKPFSYQEASVGLTTVLRAFPKLKSLRIHQYDKAYHLGGCLSAEQSQYVVDLKPGTQLFQLLEKNLGWFEYRRVSIRSVCMGCHWHRAKAIREGNISMTDLRFSNNPCKAPECIFLPETLKTLRMTIDGTFFEQQTEDQYFCTAMPALPFVEALTKLENLEDLVLSRGDAHDRGNEHDVGYTANVFQAVQNASKLQRFELHGDWVTARRDLVAFIQGHASSLRHLILRRTILLNCNWLDVIQDSARGDWLDTLHDVARLTEGHLEYLKVLDAYVETEDRIVEEEFDTYTHSQWPQFTCVTDFGSQFRLLPDSVTFEDDMWDLDQGDASTEDSSENSSEACEDWETTGEDSGDERWETSDESSEDEKGAD